MVIFPKRWRDPVIADRTVDVMSAYVWACYAAWGVASVIAGLGTIEDATSVVGNVVWGAAVGIFALIAFMAAFSTFFSSRTVLTRIKRKQVELIAVSILAGFISLYPIYLGIAALNGDAGRIAPFFAAASYLGLPTWRVRHLFLRIRKLTEVTRIGVSR